MSGSLIILLSVFLATIALGVPICFGIGTASILSLLASGMPLQMVPQKIFVGIDSFTLLAVPFFILCGDLMITGGISKRLIDLANNLIGWVKGGLAYVCILSSAFFGAISGSALATTSAIGGLLYPEMLRAKYKPSFAAALGAVGGTLGILIPPSIAFIVFGTQTGTSVTKLFAVGFPAGIIVAIFYCVAARVELYVSKAQTIQETIPTLRDVGRSVKNAFWGILSPVIVLGGIYSGVFTATEAAVIAVVYSIFVGFFVYKELSFKKLVEAMFNAAVSSAVILFLVGIASLFSYIMTYQGVARMLLNTVSSSGLTAITFLLVINLTYLVMGMLMETVPIIILTAPIFFPIAMSLNIDPIHFGAITVINLAFGLFTPPFGTCVFMATSYSKQPVMSIVKSCRMFYIFGLLALLMITYVPGSILWILKLLY